VVKNSRSLIIDRKKLRKKILTEAENLSESPFERLFERVKGTYEKMSTEELMESLGRQAEVNLALPAGLGDPDHALMCEALRRVLKGLGRLEMRP